MPDAVSSSQQPPAQSSSPSSAPRPRLIWYNIAFLTLTPLAALIFTPIYFSNHPFSWGLLAFLLITYTISNMSITCGYHRYFSHRSYDVHPWIENLYIFFASGAFQGSVLSWCTDHRRHHRSVDTNEDPYNINRGFFFAHFFWMFREDPHPDAEVFPKDLTKSKFIVWQHKYYAIIATFVGFVLPGLMASALGYGFWGGVIIGGALRITLSQHSTFLINSAAHFFGRQPYTDKNTARDSHFLAFLTFGEGYHNFHHFFQADYRNGIRWYQWDPTKWWIDALAMAGLASRLKKAKREEIFKARLAMEERMMLSRGASHEKVAQLKNRVVEAQNRIRQMHDDYLAVKRSFKERRQAKGREMRAQFQAHVEHLRNLKRMKRAEVKMAKIEFSSAYTQWRTFRRALPRSAAA
jgi:stearoyl-CoA desaturase (delta-9 desaturase)